MSRCGPPAGVISLDSTWTTGRRAGPSSWRREEQVYENRDQSGQRHRGKLHQHILQQTDAGAGTDHRHAADHGDRKSVV